VLVCSAPDFKQEFLRDSAGTFVWQFKAAGTFQIGGGMAASPFPSRSVGWLAIAIGAVTLLGIVSIVLFFVVGGVFGPLNDVCNGIEAILSAALAWALYPLHRAQSARLGRFALCAAWVGALVAIVGSALIIFDITGWYLAALYTMVGYALIGIWLFGLNYAALRSFLWPRRLAQLGLFAAVCMAIGFLAGPGMLGGVDDVGAAPWFVNIGLLGSMGWMFLYPIWSFWLGRLLISNSAMMPVATHA